MLTLRFCELRLSLAGTVVARSMDRLYGELAARGLRLRPHVWIGEEWFSPRGVSGFAVPFYLAHPRLARLERAQMGRVEGGTARECLAILRHEAGHAVQHAFGVDRRREWRARFGAPSTPYPDYYRPNRRSTRFVKHLPLWYAQAHPDEDFAETFAVWLRPRSDWRARYAHWPAARRKLEYVDRVMASLIGVRPPGRTRRVVDAIANDRRTLAMHYAVKRKLYRAPRERRREWIPL